MAVVAITGTIQDASGNGVEGVVVELRPESPSAGGAEAIGGIGIVVNAVSVSTGPTGIFSIDAVQGFRYRLVIEAIGFARVFVAPAISTVRFDTVAIEPIIEAVVDYIDDSDPDNPDIETNRITVQCAPLATVRERFDQVRITRYATLGAGSGTEVAAIDLLDNEEFYEYTDLAVNTVAYSADYYNTANLDASQGSERRASDSAAAAVLLSTDELIALYLFGVDLTDPATGEPYPDRMFEHYIDVAVQWLQKELDIDLIARDYYEVQDHYAGDYGRWGWFQLDHYPVRRVDSLEFQYPSMSAGVTILDDWIILVDDGLTGVVQVVPGQGNIADVLLIPGMLMPIWSGATGRVPGVWRISYRSGFEPGKTPAEGGLPADLKHLVAMAASIGVLNIAGDLLAGAGIASQSISVPGLSQSIGTTSSATNSGYGARIIEYQKEIKEALPNLRRYYGKGTRLVVV